MIKVAFIDDNPAVVFGVQAALNQQEGIELVFFSNDTCDFLEKLKTTEVDILIVDIVLGDTVGLNFLSDLRNDYPNKPIIAYSNAQGDSIHLYLDRIGIHHLISKKEPMQVLVDAILALKERNPQQDEINKNDSIVLSDREYEILILLGKGFSSTDIADRVNISHNTVNFHKKKLLKKFNVDSIAEMIRDAVDLGFYQK